MIVGNLKDMFLKLVFVNDFDNWYVMVMFFFMIEGMVFVGN